MGEKEKGITLESRVTACEARLIKGDNKIDNIEDNIEKVFNQLENITKKIDNNGKIQTPIFHIHSTFIDKEAIEEIKKGWVKLKRWLLACGIGAGIGAGGIASWLSGIFH